MPIPIFEMIKIKRQKQKIRVRRRHFIKMRSHYSSFIILCISATIVQCIQFTLVNTACGFQKGSIQTVNCTKIDPSIETLALHPYLTKNTFVQTIQGEKIAVICSTQCFRLNLFDKMKYGKLPNFLPMSRIWRIFFLSDFFHDCEIDKVGNTDSRSMASFGQQLCGCNYLPFPYHIGMKQQFAVLTHILRFWHTSGRLHQKSGLQNNTPEK